MTINSTAAASGPYIGTGVSQTLPFDFHAASADEVRVEVDGDAVTGFSVVLEDDGTGSVIGTFTAGSVIYIESDPSFAQETDFNRFAPYYPDSLNPPLDRAAIRDIALKGKVDRALIAPIGAPDAVQYFRDIGFRGSDSEVPGPAGPTFVTLEAFRAAPSSNRKQALKVPGVAPGDFYFETSNPPYTDDGVNTIQANDTPLTTGAWRRQGADGISLDDSDVGKALKGAPVSLLTAGSPVVGAFSIADVNKAIDLAKARGVSVVDLSGQTVFVPAGVTPFTRGKVVVRNGRFLGPVVGAQQQPTAFLKLWGSVEAGVPFTSAIDRETRAFTVNQSFQRGDLLLLSDYPTDASDFYTEGPVDAFGFSTRAYGVPSTANKRQFRRKEILSVREATATGFTVEAATEHAYSTDGLQFQRINPLTGLTFQNVRFENVGMYLRHTRDIAFLGCTSYAAQIAAAMTYNTTVNFTDWDCADTDGRVDFFEASKGITITGSYRNFNSPADNGPVKVNGCLDITIDVRVEGVRGALGHAVMIDTNYDEAPSGYPDLPCLNGSVNAVVRDCDGANVFATCDPYAAKTANWQIRVTGASTSYILKAVEMVLLTSVSDFINDQGITSTIVGTSDCAVYALQPGTVYLDEVIRNPRDNSQTRVNSRLSWFINGRLKMLGGKGELTAYTPETTWVPSLMIGGSTDGVTFASPPKGTYTRVGNLLALQYSFQLTSKGAAPAGSPVRLMLPFTAFGGAGDEYSGTTGRCLNMAGLLSAVTLTTDPGAATATLWHTGPTGSVQISNSNLTDTSTIDGTILYRIAPEASA